MEHPIEIRDKRSQEWYWQNNLFVDVYGETVGSNAVAIYSVLCRHANNSTQKCWPSMETIGKKSGIKDRKTVSKAIGILSDYNIIEVEKVKADNGKHANNTYQLNDPKYWKAISETPTPPKEEKNDLPDWLNQDAWAAWVKHRKEKGIKLTPSSIKLQLAKLSKNQEDHVEMIYKSIEHNWTGIFPLIKTPVITRAVPLQVPEGKYAHLSK
jgi:replication initiation and membrane attachment protein DnaB